ncbi:MAG: lysylphosphatidylglycerol synthase domain-containing protein [Kouleothrix sp.]
MSTPARAGEVLRSYMLGRKAGVPVSVSLATVVIERLFDGLVMLLFVFVTLPFEPLPPGYATLVTFFSVLFFLALVVFSRAGHPPRTHGPGVRLAGRARGAGRPAPARPRPVRPLRRGLAVAAQPARAGADLRLFYGDLAGRRRPSTGL